MIDKQTAETDYLTDEELKRAERDAWERRLPAEGLLGRSSFGVQFLNEWSDYRDDWCDRDDWDNNDLPVRFAFEEDAWAWITYSLEADFRRLHAAWAASHARWLPKRDRYEKRRQLLTDAGLWTQDDESMSPLLYPGGPGHEPKRRTPSETYKVVPDAEMWTPVAEHDLTTPPGEGN